MLSQTEARALYLETLVHAVETFAEMAERLSQRCGECRDLGVTCPDCEAIGKTLPVVQRTIERARDILNACTLAGR